MLWQRILSSLHDFVPCTPSSPQLPEAQCTPGCSKDCRRRGKLQTRVLAHPTGVWALLYLLMDKGVSLKQRGLSEGLYNSPKYNFINLHSCKIQHSSFGSGYFCLNLICTAVMVLICLLTVKSLFIGLQYLFVFFAKHPFLRMAPYSKVFF